MYEKFNLVSDLIERAKVIVVEKDRRRFDHIFEAAETYCSEHRILVGGITGIEILVGVPTNRDSYFYPLYSENPFEDAKAIGRAIYRAVVAENVKLEKNAGNFAPIDPQSIAIDTNLTYREFSIFVEGRLLFKHYRLDKYRGVRLYELIDPVEITGRFIRHAIKVISPEIYLMEIYHRLYVPYADRPGGYRTYSFWRDLESELFPTAFKYSEKMLTNRPQRRGSYEGGVIDSLITGGRDDVNHAEFDAMVIRDFVASGDHIVVGDYAIKETLEKKPPGQKSGGSRRRHDDYDDDDDFGTRFGLRPSGRLQILSAMPIDDIMGVLRNISAKQLSGKSLSFVTYSLGLPDDFQLLKHTIYATSNRGDAIALADVFNSPTYELVPFRAPSGYKIGNPYVLLRFKMIDLWSLKLIHNLGSVSQAFTEEKMRATLADIAKLREITLNPEGLFQLSDFIGVYIDEDIAKKKLIAEEREEIRHKRLYPCRYA